MPIEDTKMTGTRCIVRTNAADTGGDYFNVLEYFFLRKFPQLFCLQEGMWDTQIWHL